MEKLRRVMGKISEKGIRSRKALAYEADLYAELWFALDGFIGGTVFRSSNNVMKIREQKEMGVDVGDLHMNALARCVEMLDKVLALPKAGHIPYLYEICNNVIIDSYRKVSAEYKRLVSYNRGLLQDENDAGRDAKTNEKYMIDKAAFIEPQMLSKETVLRVYGTFCDNADALVCALAKYVIGDRPRELASLLIEYGSVDRVLDLYREELSLLYRIDMHEFPAVASTRNIGLSRALRESHREDFMSRRVSNILNRYKDRLPESHEHTDNIGKQKKTHDDAEFSDKSPTVS